MDFRFTNEHSASRLDEIVDYLRGPRLWIPEIDYPDYHDWLQRVHDELRTERKRVMVAIDVRAIAGVVVYQRHKTDPDTLEVKNITVRPDQRGRHVASFLLRNAEIEGRREFPSVVRATCDAKRGNEAVRWFLLRQRYDVAGAADLYGLGAGDDLVFRKSLLLAA